ncbi:MAG: heme/copper-type cytochrome/quinol oxidase subunit 1 [Urechidicola sp.]
MRKKETFWLLGTISFVLILILWIFGIDGLKSDAVTDINVHDTYFVIANIHLIVLIITLIFFGVYLIRMLRRNFKNIAANLVFMISGLLSIWILTGMISLVNSYIGVTETTEYNLPVTNNMFDNVSTILYLTQITIVGLMAYSGFKTGRNYKQTE